MSLAGAVALLLKLPQSSAAVEPGARSVRITTYVPARLYFPKRSATARLSLTALALTKDMNTVSSTFSDGQAVGFGSSSSALSVRQENRGRRHRRESVLLKNLAAWVIDAVWQSVRQKRDPTTVDQLRSSFDGFQRQPVLESVTPASLFDLVSDTDRRRQVTSVVWNGTTLRFKVK